MNRPKTLPTFDDPPVDRRAVLADRLNVFLVVAGACLTYAIAAIHFLGPAPCSTQALTPACFAALTEDVHLVR